MTTPATHSSTPYAVEASGARSLTTCLGVADCAIADTLFVWVEQNQVLLAVKEISTGRYVYVNPPMAALLGRPAAQVNGLTDSDLMEPGQWTSLRTSERSAAADGQPQLSEHKIERAGQRREFRVLRAALANADGSPPRYLCSVWTDITTARRQEAQLQHALQQLEEQQHANAALQHEAQHHDSRDADTGLDPHKHFDDQLRRELDLSSRENREFALVCIVLDPLSDAALSSGPAARARVLQALGRLLRRNTRAMDAACCINEERFAVLLSGVGLATAHSRMEGLRRQCATQIIVLEGKQLGFSVSMGVSSFPHTALTQEELLAASEAAMHEARRRGGNRVTLASIRFEPA